MREDDPAYPFVERGRVGEETVGVYLAFMREVGFIPGPAKREGEGKVRPLPSVMMSEEMKMAWRGRSGR